MMVYLERVLRSPKKAEDIQSEHAKLRTAVCDASQGAMRCVFVGDQGSPAVEHRGDVVVTIVRVPS